VAPSLAGLSDLIAKAKYQTRHPNLGAGSGTLIVSSMRVFEARSGPTFVAEFLVEASTPESTNKPGTTCSYVRILAGKQDTVDFYLGLVRALLEAVNGEAVDGPTTDRILSAEQPLRGARVKFQTQKTITKEKKTEIDAVSWFVCDNTAETLVTGRAALDAAGM
jgi:hypothetical protein